MRKLLLLLLVSGWVNAQITYTGSPTFTLNVSGTHYHVLNTYREAIRSHNLNKVTDGTWIEHSSRSTMNFPDPERWRINSTQGAGTIYKISNDNIIEWGGVQHVGDKSSLQDLKFYAAIDFLPQSPRNNGTEVINLTMIHPDTLVVSYEWLGPGSTYSTPAINETKLYRSEEAYSEDGFYYNDQFYSKHELIQLYRSRGIGFYSDPIYTNIDQFDANSFFNAFKADARRHGVVLDNDVSDFSFRLGRGPAYGIGNCSNGSTIIGGVSEGYWNWQVIHDNFSHKLFLMWHEFGHALLNQAHLCQRGHIMTGRHQRPKTVFSDDECLPNGVDGRGHWHGGQLSWNGNNWISDDLRSEFSWERAVDDLFGGVWQYNYCTQSKGGQQRFDSCNTTQN